MRMQSIAILIICFLSICCRNYGEKTRESVLSRYPGGEKREVLFYAGDTDEQLVKEIDYYQNGQTRSETKFKDGKKHGKETWRYENGGKRSETYFKNGQKHGRETLWYKSSGENIRKLRTDYQNGLKHGKERRWDDDGTLTWEGIWKNGHIIKHRGLNSNHRKIPPQFPDNSR